MSFLAKQRYLNAALCVLGLLARSATGQDATQRTPSTYQAFRYDEDWSYLTDESKRTDWLDPLKYISLGKLGWFVTLGGELREKFELLDQPGFGTGPKDDTGYLLQRYLLCSDFHLGPNVRFFGEIQSGVENGRAGGPRPTDLDRLDVHQAFLDWKIVSSEMGDVTIRIGRQELGFGSGRLISPAEGLNLRRSMDGGRLTVQIRKFTWNATLLRLVRASPGIFDDVPDHTQTFWGTGITAPIPFWKRANIAAFYLGVDRKNAIFEKGMGNSTRHTIGAHTWKTTGRWDLDYEGIAQWGSFRGAPIRAWALSENTGYTVAQSRFRPRVGVRSDIASGDGGPTAKALGSFDPLLPAIPVYSGPSALLGPTNLVDVSPSALFTLSKTTSLTFESSSFWRQSLGDGIYSPFTTPIRRGALSGSRYVATAPSITLGWHVNRHVFCSVIYTHFIAGAFLRENPPHKDVNYVATWISYRF